MILVVGATGLVGNDVCRRLRMRTEPVRALVRATSSEQTIELLKTYGVELSVGDLKDPKSIAAACQGVEGVISTASCTLSRQPGDSIQSVDELGQLNLVEAAKKAGVERFLFVSYRRDAGLSYPLATAKERVENAVRYLNYTVVQASWFMEVWLSPALGFDYLKAEAHIYGQGINPISWVSYRDVGEICAIAVRHPAAERQIIEFGGPEAISPREVVARFERAAGRPFRTVHISEQTLLSEFEAATDPLQKSFAGLMLGYAHGSAMNMAPVIDRFGIHLSSVDNYARNVLRRAAAA